MSSKIELIGMPFDAYSSYLRGAAEAPPKIREMFACNSANSFSELDVDLADHPRIVDRGDLSWTSDTQAFELLEAEVASVLATDNIPLVFGGDHSITFPIMKAVAAKHQKITILHFDAHGDLYDDFEGNPLSHASPFARIMENHLASRLVQVGIRTLNTHQREQVERFGVEVHQMKDWRGPEQLELSGPLYVSIDIDALDPAYAPGVSHHEPGGLSVRQILDVIHAIDLPIIGADIVEYNPTRDINDMTGMVAAKIYKEISAAILLNSEP